MLISLFLISFFYITKSQRVSVQNFHSGVSEMVRCNSDVLFILTTDNTVYKLRNDKWINLSKEFILSAQTILEDSLTIGAPLHLIKSPYQDDLIIVVGSNGFNWILTQCADNITSKYTERTLLDIKFHPANSQWVLFSSYSLCSDYVEECKVVKELYFSSDLLSHFKLLKGYVNDFSWAPLPTASPALPPNRILVTFESRGRGNQTFTRFNYKNDFAYSDDFFTHTNYLIRKGNKFFLSNNFLFVEKVLDQDTEETEFYKANLNDKNYTFTKVDVQAEKDNSYFILGSKDSYDFLFLKAKNKENCGDLYMSDFSAANYTLSIRNGIIKSEVPDFFEIKSIRGRYLINVIDNKILEEKGSELNKLLKEKFQKSYDDYIVTMITLDKGKSWRRIKLIDSNNEAVACQECYLNLYGYSSEIPQILVSEDRPGLVLSNGNAGKYLNSSYSSANLYLSVDGGLSWKEVKKGLHTFIVSDNGSFLVISKFKYPTNFIEYSADEGETWEKVTFAKESNVNVKQIVHIKERKFLLIGENDKKENLIIKINLNSLDLPICQVGDYTKWDPSSSFESARCLDGKRISYLRKKTGIKCVSDEKMKGKISVEFCNCTVRDFNCDVGYSRKSDREPCTLVDKTIPTFPQDCVGFYKVSRGYIKISGNECINGGEYEPFYSQCPSSTVEVVLKTVFYFVLGVFFLMIAFFLWVKPKMTSMTRQYFTNEQQKNMKSNLEKYVGLGDSEKDDDDCLNNQVF